MHDLLLTVKGEFYLVTFRITRRRTGSRFRRDFDTYRHQPGIEFMLIAVDTVRYLKIEITTC